MSAQKSLHQQNIGDAILRPPVSSLSHVPQDRHTEQSVQNVARHFGHSGLGDIQPLCLERARNEQVIAKYSAPAHYHTQTDTTKGDGNGTVCLLTHHAKDQRTIGCKTIVSTLLLYNRELDRHALRLLSWLDFPIACNSHYTRLEPIRCRRYDVQELV